MKTLAIEGELTIFTAAEHKAHLLAFMSCRDKVLEINLAKVNEIDTAGLQLLILIKREARQAGKALCFVMHSNCVQDIMELARLFSSFGDPVVLTHTQELAL